MCKPDWDLATDSVLWLRPKVLILTWRGEYWHNLLFNIIYFELIDIILQKSVFTLTLVFFFVLYIFSIVTMIPFIKAIKAENIQGGEYFL